MFTVDTPQWWLFETVEKKPCDVANKMKALWK